MLHKKIYYVLAFDMDGEPHFSNRALEKTFYDGRLYFPVSEYGEYQECTVYFETELFRICMIQAVKVINVATGEEIFTKIFDKNLDKRLL